MGIRSRGNGDAEGPATQQKRDVDEATKNDVARAPEQVSHDKTDAAAALETMIQSTRRLDEILERMCADKKQAAERTPSDSESSGQHGFETTIPGHVNEILVEEQVEGAEGSSDGDAGLEDCSEEATEKAMRSSRFPEARTVLEYFQLLQDALMASSDGVSVAVPVRVVLLDNQDAGVAPLPDDTAAQFARIARDTTFLFPALAHSSMSATRLKSSEFTDNHDAAQMGATTPECCVSLERFAARLTEELLACDHLLPRELADAVARQTFLELSSQEKKLLETADTLFPVRHGLLSEESTIQWTQGSRVCKILVKESERNRQWGLLLRLRVKSLLRPQALTHVPTSGASHPTEADKAEGPLLSSCTRHALFLPKRCYTEAKGRENALQVVMKVELQLSDERSRNAVSNGAPIPQTAYADEMGESAWTKHLPSSTVAQLPEVLNVALWGQHDNIPPEYMNQIHGSIRKTSPAGDTISFTRLEIETPFPRNRIVQAACSRYHTLFLNDMGLVFACGHAMDGALGLGPDCGGYVAKPTLLDYFFDSLVIVRHIACGGDHLGGAHSAAVTQEGHVYTWGVGIALGNGVLQSVATPKRITFPRTEDNRSHTRTGGSDADATQTEADQSTSITTIASVTCGSGFCVALTVDGQAFSWGKWSDGRLGLGKIPVIARISRRGGGAVRRQFKSFQLTPREVLGVGRPPRFLKVACGDAHCVAITLSGHLVTWGRGNNGQLGRGDANDATIPTAVFQTTKSHKVAGDNSHLKWKDAVAGENWSMALSADGRVWSWGACGGAVLGHGSGAAQKTALLAEAILQRYQKLITHNQKKPGSIACPTLPRLAWMTPQVIPCFCETETRICRLSAGVQHAAAISVTGDLYMWGEGFGEDESQALTSLPTLVNSGQRPEADALDDNKVDIGTHSVEYVVCGGRQVVAFTSGSFLARSMTELYQGCVSQPEEHEQTSGIFGADIALVVAGKRLMAHKLLLARRSPVLRELIIEEEQRQLRPIANDEVDGDQRHVASETSAILELLLPRLRADVARALIEFVYTDNLSIKVDAHESYYLIRDVLRAANMYQLPSLVHLCRGRLFSVSSSSLFGVSENQFGALDDVAEAVGFADGEDVLRVSDSSLDNDDGECIAVDGAPHTLNDDMKAALVESTWSDITLVAEGHKVPVHRCMLVSRSEYFRAVLAFRRDASSFMGGTSAATVIHVEDSHAGILRVLRFIYHDQVTLPTHPRKSDDAMLSGEDDDEDSEQLVEDLLAADKYGLDRMKRLCEHAIRVTEANCLEVLAVAELVHAAHLKQVAMRFVLAHLSTIVAQREKFQLFQTDSPHLMQELYSSIRDASREELLLREWHKAVGASLEDQRKQQEQQWSEKSEATPFPWVPLTLSIAFGGIFLSMMHAQEHEFSGVPAINIAAVAAVLGAVLLGWF